MEAACQACNVVRVLDLPEPRSRAWSNSIPVSPLPRRRYQARKGAGTSPGAAPCLRDTERGHSRPLRRITCAVAAPEAPGSINAPIHTTDNRQGPVVVIDNYDSFTYNLCQYLGDLGCEHVVFRNDEISVPELREMAPRGLLISPGPGTPEDSGISLETVRELGPSVPLFGVCMGLQCIGQAFGGRIVRAPHGVMHGKTSPVYHNQTDQESGLLVGLSNPFTAARYHSLVIERETFPNDELEITAWTEDGLVMGARHRKYPHIEGVQFHPESIITQNGKQIVNNFISKLVLMKASQGTGS
ncbi:anthranilate synthase beta subunit [Klebsormidium nitens]|uniref:anthranilate synthase n=1 Tax=Klebsormidium nitens TaxID=105231 RepID=A0A1Y1IEU6_KLENI|nr:anthranilate synthase beta subunit [Klebsormidium nitens]|eukprot:GAQ87227.1 anthranilate synthase beta subunit [Klebsormidium nitens]